MYDNKVEVQIIDTSIYSLRNRTVYSRPITVYQGIDNPIQVLIKNQEQRPVNLTGYVVQAEIQDPNHVNLPGNTQPFSGTTVAGFAVTWGNIALGQGHFTIPKDTVNSLEQRFYKLTFKTINVSNNGEQPLYVDDNYGAPLDLQILPGYYNTSGPLPFAGNTIIDGGIL
jgi:hypothetical protein